ncbi:MAG TPA: cell division protein FtsK [Firmicutes bacterium]|jgi:DNA segregation ATPase FtsK/SpoIIIE, S-DNA-T family|nr:cell division protein FtsK [Bacillota bacterium]
MAASNQVDEQSSEQENEDRFAEQRTEIIGVLLLGLALLSLTAIYFHGAGFIGEILKRGLFYIFGRSGAIIPVILVAIIGWMLLIRRQGARFGKHFVTLLLLFLWALLILHFFSGVVISSANWEDATQGGGIVGHFLALSLLRLFGKFGTGIFMFIWLLIVVILALDRPLIVFLASLGKRRVRPISSESEGSLKKELPGLKQPVMNTFENSGPKAESGISNSNKNGADVIPFPQKPSRSGTVMATLQNMLKEKEKAKNEKKGLIKPETSAESPIQASPSIRPSQKVGEYQLPDLNLIGPSGAARQKKTVKTADQSRMLEETLANFGIQVKVLEAHHGPVVTRYDLQPAPGVKVSRIVNLADDLALALAAKGLRLEAPIPGMAAIGVEVPNQEAQIVTFRDILDSKSFWNTSRLSVGLGVDIAGETVLADLSKMPHLLVAGATGSGKSVCINTIIMSILYKAYPTEVKFVMIDPKMVELSMYNGIPHLMAPVVTEAKKAAGTLKVVVNEMERRYKLFAEARVRDLDKYNAQIGEGETLPYIVVIIDELADLMMLAPVDVEDCICRLAQMARATGIHLVVATQRPSVDVITGLIKANISSRIAFAVSSQIDSRTILDSVGAERLLGRGDMLFSPIGSMKPRRVQGALVMEKEIEAVIEHWKNQGGPKYQEHFLNIPDKKEVVVETEDELLWDAVRVVIDYGSASASVLQRRLKIGYTRAARLVDLMEAKRMIGPYEGSKPREVYITARQLEEMKKHQEEQ